MCEMIATVQQFDHSLALPFFGIGMTFSSPVATTEYQTTLPDSREMCMQVKKQWLEPDMGRRTDSKLGKAYDKAVCCHPTYLDYMQSTS